MQLKYKNYKRPKVRFNPLLGTWETKVGRKWMIPKLKRRFVTVVLTLANGKELRKRVSSYKFLFAGGKAINTHPIEFPPVVRS